MDTIGDPLTLKVLSVLRLPLLLNHSLIVSALSLIRQEEAEYEPTIVLNDLLQPWRDTTIEELKAFLAIHIYMKEHHERDLLSYWADNDWDLSHNRIRRTMSRDCFMQLQRYLQISDPGQRPMGPFDRVSRVD